MRLATSEVCYASEVAFGSEICIASERSEATEQQACERQFCPSAKGGRILTAKLDKTAREILHSVQNDMIEINCRARHPQLSAIV